MIKGKLAILSSFKVNVITSRSTGLSVNLILMKEESLLTIGEGE